LLRNPLEVYISLVSAITTEKNSKTTITTVLIVNKNLPTGLKNVQRMSWAISQN